jgi:hypothetical protein
MVANGHCGRYALPESEAVRSQTLAMRASFHLTAQTPNRNLAPQTDSLVFGLKQRFREFRLPNDAPQGSASDRIVKRNRNSYRCCLQTLLHDSVAALLPDEANPCCSRIRQTSEPERTRSLPNRHLDLSHENFAMKTPGDFGRGGSLEE